MATTSNPFEPPRTTDLDGDPAPRTQLVVSEEARQELIAAAPWVRWFARVTAASIVVGLLGAVADLVGKASVGSKAKAMFGVAVSTLMSTLLLVALRRYADASERLRAGLPDTADSAVDAQASYVRRLGVLTTVGIVLFILVLIGMVIAAMRSQ
jgi:hypothetical protein